MTFGEAAARAWTVAAALGWRPGEFWDSTPAELAGALAPPDQGEPPNKQMIEALMQRFPDRSE